jgi:AraC family transcriptional regulator
VRIVRHKVTVRQLYSGTRFGIAEFTCLPDDPRWREQNVIESAVPLVVFPLEPVVIEHEHGSPVLATPNVAMLYNPGEVYRREMRSGRGDRCLEIQLREPAVEALAAEGMLLPDGGMPATHAPATSTAFFVQHLLGRSLSSAESEELLCEHIASTLVRSVLGSVAGEDAAAAPLRPAQRDLAEHAKELLGATLVERPGLPAIARRVGSSPFHLARVFRRYTGFSLHEYRRQLRLRLALDRLCETDDLTGLAFELGFASHSHLTDSFRREFGVPPSAVRDKAKARRLLESSHMRFV